MFWQSDLTDRTIYKHKKTLQQQFGAIKQGFSVDYSRYHQPLPAQPLSRCNSHWTPQPSYATVGISRTSCDSPTIFIVLIVLRYTHVVNDLLFGTHSLPVQLSERTQKYARPLITLQIVAHTNKLKKETDTDYA